MRMLRLSFHGLAGEGVGVGLNFGPTTGEGFASAGGAMMTMRFGSSPISKGNSPGGSAPAGRSRLTPTLVCLPGFTSNSRASTRPPVE